MIAFCVYTVRYNATEWLWNGGSFYEDCSVYKFNRTKLLTVDMRKTEVSKWQNRSTEPATVIGIRLQREMLCKHWKAYVCGVRHQH